jgi:PhoH-like ATPase
MSASTKIFVIDTSVILYDYNSIYSFHEHDVAIPIVVLEEIDQFKKGSTIINMHAREFVRNLDKLSEHNLLHEWIPFNGSDSGKLKVIQEGKVKTDVNDLFGNKTNDHRILNACLFLIEEYPDRKIILVTKDINLRVKAKSLSIEAEDYETGKIKNPDHLNKGFIEHQVSDPVAIDDLYDQMALPFERIFDEEPVANQYLILTNQNKSALAYYNSKTKYIERVNRQSAYGIQPRNAEQTFAMHAIMNEDVKLVTISGTAGTGKTLLSLAGALEVRQDYRQIFVARPIVPLSNKDIGYLPGDIKSKIDPYMQPLWDNLDFIKNQYKESDSNFKRIKEMLEQDKIQMSPLAYIRGRSLSNIFFIVDEAQNLTPHEIKTIITRAGEGTKLIFTGDIFQIDTPYLDSQSNGLSYLIDRIQDHPLHAHINLEKGERSELANLASDLL